MREPERPQHAYPDMLWSGWGDPAEATTLSAEVLGLLEQGLGVERAGRPAPAIESVELGALAAER